MPRLAAALPVPPGNNIRNDYLPPASDEHNLTAPLAGRVEQHVGTLVNGQRTTFCLYMIAAAQPAREILPALGLRQGAKPSLRLRIDIKVSLYELLGIVGSVHIQRLHLPHIFKLPHAVAIEFHILGVADGLSQRVTAVVESVNPVTVLSDVDSPLTKLHRHLSCRHRHNLRTLRKVIDELTVAVGLLNFAADAHNPLDIVRTHDIFVNLDFRRYETEHIPIRTLSFLRRHKMYDVGSELLDSEIYGIQILAYRDYLMLWFCHDVMCCVVLFMSLWSCTNSWIQESSASPNDPRRTKLTIYREKSFYESGKSLFRKDYFWKYFFQSPWKPAP